MKNVIKASIITATLFISASLYAEQLSIPSKTNNTLQTPQRGMSMSTVKEQFGSPMIQHDAVGEPPITRWDYTGYSVYFEHEYVITSVLDSQ